MSSAEHSRPVAVVTGASRGLGRGIAIALGEAGFIVYCTGRSDRQAIGPWGGTVRDTAEAIDKAGGKGIVAICDHLDDSQTEALFKRVDAERGRLDLLVNNAFAMPDWAVPDGNFWERPLSLWRDMIDVGLRSSYAASHFAAPIMVRQRSGLIANTSGPGGKIYRHSLPYGVGKAGQDKLAHDMAHELRPFDVAAISLWPGLIGTERTLAGIAVGGVVGENAGGLPHIETPFFVGRVLAAIHAADDARTLSGGTFYSTELAARYGVLDADGRLPVSRRAMFGAPLYAPISGEAVEAFS
ncbi:NAD(P)-dependent dehydrogenase (short-subunit alcohol dehydrogenase family) [Aminobacter lissarensis]|uniref:NAD(P)-dependent dehydrogenase (Short-subunit alcohol dehydrogenase family) n=1 Tax=Aminobacter carboxidus TaxID=376165 RepID=A0A8E1WC62_9HYPH|nr:SDR family NAD(P)-dependent oxidoreductase [Aminobacter lissarensis]MBB6465283.1 NAD(P)-dependent dehydrogenase (short-subunit alcohol dehydrogenase family) [Aminobacter lissarensis]